MLEQNKEFDSIKLIDFGTAIVQDGFTNLDEHVGTAYYIAPEVLTKNYNEKCDIWSCGVLLYIFLSGMPPFIGKNDEDTLMKINRGEYNFNDTIWSKVSGNAKDFISLLMTYDMDERPSAAAALNHPWLT